MGHNPRQRHYYVASAWWRGCDPFLTVVSTTARKTENAVMKAVREEAQWAYDDGSYERVYEAVDDIRWSGVFPETEDFVRNNILDSSQMAELKRNLIVYV